MERLRKGTWVVVADGEKALFLENVTDAIDPHLQVFRAQEQDNPPDREQASDRPGRQRDHTGAMPATGAMQRSGMAETDFHQLEKDRFAASLSDILYGYAHRGKFDRLVLVAAPHVLGELRNTMHKEVSARVVAEIAKTLTNHPVVEIEKVVQDALSAGQD